MEHTCGGGALIAYAQNLVIDDYVEFQTMKFDPEYLKLKASAALIYKMIEDYINKQEKLYINDGERSVRHITNFQQYLEKYFGFRKAYCNLHIEYREDVKMVVTLLYPFRKVIDKFKGISFFNSVAALLEMERICREG